MTDFPIGALVRARNREWVVVPGSDDAILRVRPLEGTDDEVAGILRGVEEIQAASFGLPDPDKPGSYLSCRLLRDAVRLGSRASTGPFRSFGAIAVEPRPYQLVPLIMALRLDPVRMLIADDVGIGKTVESLLIARELKDRGEIDRLTVLCPPHLAEQWQAEMRDKFQFDETEVLLPSTIARLERGCLAGQSVFERYPLLVVSIDYIKSHRHRYEFLRTAPPLVIVDEAHTCVAAGGQGSAAHQRYELVKELVDRDPERHMLFVTATPHSGKQDAFRALVDLLNPEFEGMPEDLTGKENEANRRRVARHFVQRRRGDIVSYLGNTRFPEREPLEATYKLTQDYARLFERVLRFARESVGDAEGTSSHRYRVRWWSALALLRSLASSPAAAAVTLRNRSAVADTETPEEADEVGRRILMDIDEDEGSGYIDVTPGADVGGDDEESQRIRRRLQEFARDADKLCGAQDQKLKDAAKLLQSALDEGYRPIVFCHFIPTVHYLVEHLPKLLKGKVAIAGVTGEKASAEREETISDLVASGEEHRILVCTDCLSEGINLQEHFDAVMHYDLAWNPTRHEQREGRVDRFNQASPTVRIIQFYGSDNKIDGAVLKVLLEKYQVIRGQLGISVPVPVNTADVMAAIQDWLLSIDTTGVQDTLPGFEDYMASRHVVDAWDDVLRREKRSRSMFAQAGMVPQIEEVQRELEAVTSAIGGSADVEAFVRDGFKAFDGTVVAGDKPVAIDLTHARRSLRDGLGMYSAGDAPVGLKAVFDPPAAEGETWLSRTHPIVAGLADYIRGQALDGVEESVASRCGVIETTAVDKRTTVLLLRFRYHLLTTENGESREQLAEECRVVGFAGAPGAAEWLDDGHVQSLLEATPSGNTDPARAAAFLRRVVDDIDTIRPRLDEMAVQRGEELLEAHRRVRDAVRKRTSNVNVRPEGEPDLLGVYVYLPAQPTTPKA